MHPLSSLLTPWNRVTLEKLIVAQLVMKFPGLYRQVYLDMLQTSIFLAIRELLGDERFYLQDGAPPHYHRDVRAYLDDTLPGRWVGRRGAIEYQPRSPDLTPLDFCPWGTLKDEVYRH
ncbi:hypothetical protein B7P43_G08609 [Cryptotermes secundus]|uniref:Uncharacterized protein n=1 Tax=Cryptotermes secundus TaxID=105785 RepID=A0A2J7QZ19_9NEOP|nr:hypothetical protein B7P43_G08609 [Cryptotermes secundus]